MHLRIFSLTVLAAFLTGVSVLAANDSIPVFYFTAEQEDRLILDEAVRFYADTTGSATIMDMLGESAPEFVKRGHPSLTRQGAGLWYRVRAHNQTSLHVRKSVYVSWGVAEGEVYLTEGRRIVGREVTGTAVAPNQKFLYSRKNYVELGIPPGTMRTLYLKVTSGKDFLDCCPQVMIANSPRVVNAYLFQRTTGRFFYFGIMSFIGVISFFSFYLFRKPVFVSFGALMIIFGFYFIVSSASEAPLFPNGTSLPVNALIQLSLISIYAAFYHFTTTYLNLRKRLPSVYGALTVLTVLIVGLLLKMLFFGMSPNSILAYAYQSVGIIWILLIFFAILRMMRAGSRPAGKLAFSFLFLLIGALLTLFENIGLLPRSFWTDNGLIIGSVFFAGIIFRELLSGLTDLRREKNELSETNTLKSRFFANITHEFRTPLTLMLAPLRQVIAQSDKPDNVALLRLAERNAERQLELVDQLLELARLDVKALKLQAAPADFLPYLRRTVTSYESLAEQKGIDLRFVSAEETAVLYFDAEKTDRILLNLLSNAFKFTGSGQKIEVALTQDAEEVKVIVADTGRGIDAKLLPHVFDRFFLAGKSDNEASGSGIGLALVREMVHLHHGTVTVASQFGEGTSFTIRLPKGKAHLSAEELAVQPSPARTNVSSRPKHLPQTDAEEPGRSPEKAEGMATTVLLVEDNDEMRGFIAQMLEPQYKVITAQDGAEGISKALAEPPDLIVSDLMMPLKDGFDLCRELKADIRTSHVPIILLTARASRDARLTGLDEGADDYLTKPFDARELMARAANLIRSRKRLRERFATSIQVKPSELTVSRLDKDFMTRAVGFVEEHIDDGSLSVDTLAAHLSTSRTQLNLKLRALVDQSTNQFIQQIRLQRAAGLMRQGESAKQVAYACGFSSPAYFSRVFKETFGLTPGAYAREAGGAVE